MEQYWLTAVIAFAALAAALLLRLVTLKRGLHKLQKDLHTLLQQDTNGLLKPPTRDKDVRALASALNRELTALNKKRLCYENGDLEIKNAVTNIAHDLRTPLTAVSGYLELLEHHPLSEEAARYLAVVRERTEAMKALTEELFRYSVVVSTADDFELKRLCLNDELEKALVAAYGVLNEHGLIPAIQIPSQKIIINGNDKALQRIFGNILTNAAKYATGDLRVTLQGDGSVIFSNTATLTEVEVGKLFDRFYTVENARGATGLGLSIAKLLTEKTGGQIEASLEQSVLSIRLQFPVIK